MRTLLLIPSAIDPHSSGHSENRPRADYTALQEMLGADILDYSSLTAECRPALIRLARHFGRDAALAALGYAGRRRYDIIYANGENVAIPLALLLKRHAVRPRLVTIGHRLSARKKRLLLRVSQSEMDAIFVYASAQERFARVVLGVPVERLHRIPFHVDHVFFRCLPGTLDESAPMISSAGLEWRDYPTLVEAVRGLDVALSIAAASPWSRSRNELSGVELPSNVTARPYDYRELRKLYAQSRAVVVPLHSTDFQAGITTILEGMAMAKPVIATRTSGQTDTIVDGETGLYVPPSDPEALRKAILGMLQDTSAAQRIGERAREEVEHRFTLDHWIVSVAAIMRSLV